MLIISRFNARLAMARSENAEGYYDIHTNSVLVPAATQPTRAKWEEVSETAETQTRNRTSPQPDVEQTKDDVDELSSRFEALEPIYARNFMIQDFHYQDSVEPGSGFPGADNDQGKLPKLSAELLDELPEECRRALEDSVRREQEWSSQWRSETLDGKRSTFVNTVEWYP